MNELNKHSTDVCDMSYAESFLHYVYLELDDIKKSFFKIGFRLNEANKYKYYEELGYSSIAELAEDKFGFKKSTTYDLMAIYELAHDNMCPMSIDKSFEGFSQSQLVAMTRVRYAVPDFVSLVKPTDSVKSIEKLVSLWNKKYVYGCGYRPGCYTVSDYLKKYEEEDNGAPAIYPNQLKGQLAIELPEDKDKSKSKLLDWQDKAREAAHAAGLPFYAGTQEEFEQTDGYVFDGNMSVEDYKKMWELRESAKEENSRRLENSENESHTNREYLQTVITDRFAYLICEAIEKIKKKNNTKSFTDIVMGLAVWLDEQQSDNQEQNE